MSQEPGPSYLPADSFKVEDMQLAGIHPQLVCYRCNEQVTEATCLRSLEALWMARFYAHCHGRATMVDAPMELFAQIPNWRSVNPNATSRLNPHRFVVGFDGEWEVKLHDYNWLLQRPHAYYAAFGVYKLEELEKLFAPMLGYDLEPKFFNLVHVESKIAIPAEFWFPVPKEARSALDIGNPLDRFFPSS